MTGNLFSKILIYLSITVAVTTSTIATVHFVKRGDDWKKTNTPSFSTEQKHDFTGDGVAEKIEENYSSEDWTGFMYIKDGSSGDVLKEVKYMTKTAEWQIVWSNKYTKPYLLTLSSFSDAYDLTTVYEFKNGNFVKSDAWGVYINKDSLPYTHLHRCGIEEDSFGYDINKGRNISESDYNSYKERYEFEILDTSKKN